MCALLLLLAVGAPLAAQRGALVMPRNLGELVDQAERIVVGRVAIAYVEPHPDFQNLNTVVVTLRIEEVLKGPEAPTFTFRQFIWDIRDRYDAAGYRKGQRLLLLTNRPTSYGLRSPTGLEQGRFRILRDQQGSEIAVNGHANRGLFRGLAPQLAQKGVELPPKLSALVAEHHAGPISLQDLRDIIRQMARER